MSALGQVTFTDPRAKDVASAAYRAMHLQYAQLARLHPAFFNAFVIKDERSGSAIEMTQLHKHWHDLAAREDRLVIWSHVESGKTTQMAVGRALYEIGKDSAIRVAIVSNTYGQAEKILHSISQYVEKSDDLHTVFPKLQKGEPWTNTQLFVRRPVFSKDPTVQACGVHGNIVGARIDLLILDDVLDYENCRTPKARQDLWDWYHATLAGRLTKGARVIVIGTAYHPEDFLHRLAKTPGWSAYRYPVLDEHGESRWPDVWPKDRIEKKRLELGPVEFARQMLCIARDDSEARFKREWIDVALKKGEGRNLAFQLHIVPFNCRTFTGVDLAVQKHSASDFTVMLTIIVHPTGERELLSVERGKWSGPEIVNRIHDVHRRYQSIVIVENNSAQDYIVQFARELGNVPIKPFTTGKNKASPEFGVESIAAEMAMGKWIIPNIGGRVDPTLDPLMNEMLYYDPAAHTGDCLMAMWFAREGMRLGDSSKPSCGYIDLLSR